MVIGDFWRSEAKNDHHGDAKSSFVDVYWGFLMDKNMVV